MRANARTAFQFLRLAARTHAQIGGYRLMRILTGDGGWASSSLRGKWRSTVRWRPRISFIRGRWPRQRFGSLRSRSNGDSEFKASRYCLGVSFGRMERPSLFFDGAHRRTDFTRGVQPGTDETTRTGAYTRSICDANSRSSRAWRIASRSQTVRMI